MKVKTIESLIGTDRDVKGTGFQSIRIALERDGLGFSMHKTIIKKGGPYHWHYKHHVEACYCICGQGVIKNLATGELNKIKPDSVYICDRHDDHTFEALTEVTLICIFNPPVTGRETHQDDGSYAIVTELFADE